MAPTPTADTAAPAPAPVAGKRRRTVTFHPSVVTAPTTAAAAADAAAAQAPTETDPAATAAPAEAPVASPAASPASSRESTPPQAAASVADGAAEQPTPAPERAPPLPHLLGTDRATVSAWQTRANRACADWAAMTATLAAFGTAVEAIIAQATEVTRYALRSAWIHGWCGAP